MADRVALITGGAKGIGRAVALDLAQHGWSVAICYRTSAREAEDTRATIEACGVRALAVASCCMKMPKNGWFLMASVSAAALRTGIWP